MLEACREIASLLRSRFVRNWMLYIGVVFVSYGMIETRMTPSIVSLGIGFSMLTVYDVLVNRE